MPAGSARKIIFEDDLAYLPGATEREFKISAHQTWDGYLQALRSTLEKSRGEHIREVANTNLYTQNPEHQPQKPKHQTLNPNP